MEFTEFMALYKYQGLLPFTYRHNNIFSFISLFDLFGLHLLKEYCINLVPSVDDWNAPTWSPTESDVAGVAALYTLYMYFHFHTSLIAFLYCSE